MALFENLLDSLGIDCELTPYRYRYYVYGKCGGWFEGVTIVSYSKDEVIFKIHDGKLQVKGKNLSVKKYVEKEVALTGEIYGVERI